MSNRLITAVGEILFDKYPDKKKLGGAPFNFIYHIKKITGSGAFISRVGNDDDGKNIMGIIEDAGLPKELMQLDHEHATGAVKVELDEDKIPTFTILEDRAWDYIEQTDENTALVQEKTDLLYYGTLAQRSTTTSNTIRGLASKNVEAFSDINIREPFYNNEVLEYTLINSVIVKVSEEELKLINDRLIHRDYELRSVMKAAYEEYKLKLLCVTLGSEGALLLRDGMFDHYRAEPDEIIDTVGAGDGYASILAIGYLYNWPLPKINKLANEFAARLIAMQGALPDDDSVYDPIRDALKENNQEH